MTRLEKAGAVVVGVLVGALIFTVGGLVGSATAQQDRPGSMCDAYYIAATTVAPYAHDHWIVEGTLAGCFHND